MATPAKAEIGADVEAPVTTGSSEIAVLAYKLWMDRGCPVGSPDEDWFRAERELGGVDELTATEA
jgi:Protein of unknown function (DUF2934)